MKKLLAFTLVATMLLACLTLFVSAEDPAPEPTAPTLGTEDLLGLWDFEDSENPYLDLVKGSLIWARNGVDNAHKPECMEVKDGVVKITASSIMLYLQYSQRVKIGYSGHENKTFYAKFYLDGTAVNNDAAIIWHRKNDFQLCVKEGATNTKYAFVGSFFGSDFEIPEANTPEKPTDGWYYLALTMETYDATTHKIPVHVYLSADGTTYLKTTHEIEIAEDQMEVMLHPDTAPGQGGTYSYFAFGKNNINYGKTEGNTTGVDIYYDELRFYNVPLSEDQLPLLKNAVEFPEEPDPIDPGDQTTPQIVTRAPSVTTRKPAATEAPTTPSDKTTTAPGTDAPAKAKKGGCGSAIVPSALVIVLAFAGAVSVTKKKR